MQALLTCLDQIKVRESLHNFCARDFCYCRQCKEVHYHICIKARHVADKNFDQLDKG